MNDRWWCVACKKWIAAEHLKPHPKLGSGFHTHPNCAGTSGTSALESAVVKIPGEAIAALIGAPPEAVEEWLTETVDLLRSVKTEVNAGSLEGRIEKLLAELETRLRHRRGK